MLVYPRNKEILNKNQLIKYCYTFPLRLKVLIGNFHLKSFCSLSMFQLMAFVFSNVFWDQSQWLIRIFKTCGIFYQFMQMLLFTKVLHSRFRHFRVEIACSKEIVTYFHLCIQYFSKNIQIWDNILMRAIGASWYNVLLPNV